MMEDTAESGASPLPLVKQVIGLYDHGMRAFLTMPYSLVEFDYSNPDRPEYAYRDTRIFAEVISTGLVALTVSVPFIVGVNSEEHRYLLGIPAMVILGNVAYRTSLSIAKRVEERKSRREAQRTGDELLESKVECA